MLSASQFTQFKRLLEGRMRQVECPCGELFYTCSAKAIYHSNACRQKHYRLSQVNQQQAEDFVEEVVETIPMLEVERSVPVNRPQASKSKENVLDSLKEKERIYNQKLKAIKSWKTKI